MVDLWNDAVPLTLVSPQRGGVMVLLMWCTIMPFVLLSHVAQHLDLMLEEYLHEKAEECVQVLLLAVHVLAPLE